jgi:hypothetical protein
MIKNFNFSPLPNELNGFTSGGDAPSDKAKTLGV